MSGEVVVGLPVEASPVVVTDSASVPAEPSAELLYRHRPHLIAGAKEAWQRRSVTMVLAERDIRALYKQAVLGIGWAVLNPVISLVLFVLIFDRVKLFHEAGVPYALFSYVGILGWGFFSGSVGGGINALLGNKAMLAKTHFPRECFPLSQVVEAIFSTVVALAPLVILFFVVGFAPKLGTLWTPLYIVIALACTTGATLIVSAVVIQARDLRQAIPIILQLGLFATPVVWKFSLIPHWAQPLYSFLNPIGLVIDGVRQSMLLNKAPDWRLTAIAALGSVIYLVGGYYIFKRLEVHFADRA